MNRRHLGAEDGIVFTHFLCKDDFLDGGRLYLSGFFFLLPYTDGGKERADTNPCCSKIIYLVNFQRGIDLTGLIQNISCLVSGNGIQTAPEGIKLDEVKVFRSLHVVRRGIETGMVHPLIHYIDGTLYRIQVRDRIFCQHSDIVGINKLRQTVVDFRIDVIRASGKDDPPVAGIF